MSEFYTNKYIVECDGPKHMGSIDYRIISTRDGFSELLNKLTAALARPEKDLRLPLQASDSPTHLLTEYATISHGQTSRVYLSFQLADDLSAYHIKPSVKRKLFSWVGFLAVLVILIFAIVGLCTTVQRLFH
jgi:hypothetical protein